MNARNVTVLHGAVPKDAPPDEQDVLAQVESVSAALERLDYAVEALPLTLDLQAARVQLRARSPALVFNLVESVGGSGRLAPLGAMLLEDSDLPYTGTAQTGLFASSNKLMAKQLLSLANIATPGWCTYEEPPPAAGERWITKSVWEHASIGIDDDSIVDAHDLHTALSACRERFSGEWFAEEFVEGREFNIALIGGADSPQVLPPAEIRFVEFPEHKPRIVGYAAKWTPESFEYSHTQRSFDFARAELPLLDELVDIARRCWALFACRGYARVDFRVDQHNRPWVLEVNANPCLAPDAGFATAAREAGLSYDALIARIVAHVPHS